jgi:transcriptional regulator with XRE-family HTH domain
MDGSKHRREVLIKLMDSKGTTLEELGTAIGVHPITIAKYRAGTIKLSKKKRIKAISAYYNVPESVFEKEDEGAHKPRPQLVQDIPVQEKIDIIMQHHDGFLGKLFISCVNYFYNSMFPDNAKPVEADLNLPKTLQLENMQKELAEIKHAILKMQKEPNAPPGKNKPSPFQKATARKTRHRTEDT